MKNRKQKMNSGFVVLFSILISAIILLISTGIYDVVQKQVILSSYARESQKAFYSADAALDCALFNDISPLVVQTAFPVDVISPYTIDITCGGGTTQVRLLGGITETGLDNYTAPYVFRYYGVQNDIDGEYIGSGCAYVLVEKKGTVGVSIETRVTAAGFNTCKDTITSGIYNVPDFDDPTLLERRISVSYTTI